MLGAALRAAVPVHPRARSTARRATPCCPATSSPPRTAPASCTRRSRSARTTSGSAPSRASTSSTRSGSTGPTTSASARTPAAGSRTPTPTWSRTCARAAACCAPRRYLHAYPHCWRCGTPLLYYAKPSWYIRTSPLRDRLLAANETVDWYPRAHQARALRQVAGEQRRLGDLARALLGHAAAGLAQRGGRDRRASARSPSCEELQRRRGSTIRTGRYVDDVEIPSPTGGEPLRRVPEVIDVWFDSGAMPFAQHHAPLENQDALRGALPGRLHLRGDRPDARLVLLAAGDLDAAVRPRRRTARPLPRPHRRSRGQEDVEVPRQHRRALGGDRPARRRRVPLVLLHLQAAVGRLPVLGRDGRRVAAPVPAAAVEHVRLLRPVRERQRRARSSGEPETELDRWAISRLHATTEVVRERLDDYDATRAGHAIAAFVDDLSNWYVRRSRPRFWDGDPAAFGTLHHCLVGVAQLLAPFCPFLADEIYDNLDGGEPSVHLCDFPEAGARDVELEVAMGVVRETVRLGLAARGAGQARACASRCARPSWWRPAPSARRSSGSRTSCSDELNVKELRYVSQADELGSYEVKPNYRALGPRFGKHMPQVAAAVAALDPAHVADALRDGRRVGISVDGARPRARRRRPAAGDAAARGLPARARGLARGGARARARRRAGPRGPRARGRARRAERAQGGRPGGRGPDRAHARRRRRSCWTPRARTRTTWPARRSPSTSTTTARRRASEATVKGRPLRIAVRRAGR